MIKNILNNLYGLKGNIIFKNILLVGGITMLVKLIGFYKETVVAANFGLSQILDTFFIAVLVPAFIQNVFLGAFKSVFVPNYIAEQKSGGSPGSFQSTAFIITGLISLFFVVIAFLFTDTYLEVFFAGHTSEYYDMIKSQFYYLIPCIFLWGYSSLIGGLLIINNEFKFSSFESVFVPIVIIVCLAFFKDEFGNNVLAIGTLLGSVVALLYLIVVSVQKRVISLSYPNFRNKNVQLMFKQVPAKVSSGFLTGFNTVVDQFFAAQLIIGSVAALNYGLKMPAFLMGILTIAITNVLLPQFSRMIIENRKNAQRIFIKIIQYLFLGAAVFAAIGFLLTDFLVELFFQRKEFTAEDTQVVASIQKIFLIYTPFTIAGMVVVNFLTSMNRNAIMAYVALVAVIANIILDYILMQYFGVFGIALCTTIVTISKNLFLFYFVIRLSRRELRT